MSTLNDVVEALIKLPIAVKPLVAAILLIVGAFVSLVTFTGVALALFPAASV
jgi:uncharacterized membrane protein